MSGRTRGLLAIVASALCIFAATARANAKPVMLQGTSATALREQVDAVGGELTHYLPIIDAVGAQLTAAQLEKLRELFAESRGADGRSRIPRWRVPDLPEAHALFYAGADADGDGEIDDPAVLKDPSAFGSYQNAPTQCSTCHQ